MNEAVILNIKRTVVSSLLIGKKNNNPIFDSRVYNIQFLGGIIAKYNTNIIAESLYSLTDDYGVQYSLMSGIVNHQKTEDAFNKEEGYVELNGTQKRVITTSGWKF